MLHDTVNECILMRCIVNNSGASVHVEAGFPRSAGVGHTCEAGTTHASTRHHDALMDACNSKLST